eukprot:g3945.t1
MQEFCKSLYVKDEPDCKKVKAKVSDGSKTPRDCLLTGWRLFPCKTREFVGITWLDVSETETKTEEDEIENKLKVTESNALLPENLYKAAAEKATKQSEATKELISLTEDISTTPILGQTAPLLGQTGPLLGQTGKTTSNKRKRSLDTDPDLVKGMIEMCSSIFNGMLVKKDCPVTKWTGILEGPERFHIRCNAERERLSIGFVSKCDDADHIALQNAAIGFDFFPLEGDVSTSIIDENCFLKEALIPNKEGRKKTISFQKCFDDIIFKFTRGVTADDKFDGKFTVYFCWRSKSMDNAMEHLVMTNLGYDVALKVTSSFIKQHAIPVLPNFTGETKLVEEKLASSSSAPSTIVT